LKFPRKLACVEQVKKNRTFIDPVTKGQGRCGTCRRCWRLFLYVRRQQGITSPIRWVNGKFAGFVNAKASPLTKVTA
jgi:hypothetical protein